MIRVLVLGASGMLRHKLCEKLSQRVETFATFGSARPLQERFYVATKPILDVDAFAFETSAEAVTRCRPNVVINANGIQALASESDTCERIRLHA